MTKERELQIIDQAKHQDSDGYFGFIAGAQWADENPVFEIIDGGPIGVTWDKGMDKVLFEHALKIKKLEAEKLNSSLSMCPECGTETCEPIGSKRIYEEWKRAEKWQAIAKDLAAALDWSNNTEASIPAMINADTVLERYRAAIGDNDGK